MQTCKLTTSSALLKGREKGRQNRIKYRRWKHFSKQRKGKQKWQLEEIEKHVFNIVP